MSPFPHNYRCGNGGHTHCSRRTMPYLVGLRLLHTPRISLDIISIKCLRSPKYLPSKSQRMECIPVELRQKILTYLLVRAELVSLGNVRKELSHPVFFVKKFRKEALFIFFRNNSFKLIEPTPTKVGKALRSLLAIPINPQWIKMITLHYCFDDWGWLWMADTTTAILRLVPENPLSVLSVQSTKYLLPLQLEERTFIQSINATFAYFPSISSVSVILTKTSTCPIHQSRQEDVDCLMFQLHGNYLLECLRSYISSAKRVYIMGPPSKLENQSGDHTLNLTIY